MLELHKQKHMQTKQIFKYHFKLSLAYLGVCNALYIVFNTPQSWSHRQKLSKNEKKYTSQFDVHFSTSDLPNNSARISD